MTRAFVDANVFLYAIGAEHPYQGACQELLTAVVRGDVGGETSVEVLQEVVHSRRRRGDDEAPQRAREILRSEIPVHGIEPADLERALALIEEHPALPARDAVHAATAINREIAVVLSADADFDQVGGLRRVDPLDAAGIEALRTAER